MIEHEQTQKTVFCGSLLAKVARERGGKGEKQKKQGELSAEREKLDTHTYSLRVGGRY